MLYGFIDLPTGRLIGGDKQVGSLNGKRGEMVNWVGAQKW